MVQLMSNKIFILSEKEIKSLVKLDLNIIDEIEKAFIALAKGEVEMPPILSMEMKDQRGEVDVKTAYIKNFDGFAVKISPGFFNNPSLGLPSLNGLMVLFSSKTGLVQSLLLVKHILCQMDWFCENVLKWGLYCTTTCWFHIRR